MPTINVEMMQQLLQEFADKEALTGEEIKVIEQQVQELEQRIVGCREKLQCLNEDKDRLAAMMSRYAGGKNPTGHSIEIKGSSSNTGQFKSMPRVSERKEAVKSEEPAHGQTNVDIVEQTSTAAVQNSVIEDLDAGSEPDAEKAPGKNTNAAGSDDAIKSINDALKGLFRK